MFNIITSIRRKSLSRAAKDSCQQNLLTALKHINNIPIDILMTIFKNDNFDKKVCYQAIKKTIDTAKLMHHLLDDGNTRALAELLPIIPNINKTKDPEETLLAKALMTKNFGIAKLLLARDDTTLDDKACYSAFKAIANNTYADNMANILFKDTISAAILAVSWENKALVTHFSKTNQIHHPDQIILQASKHGWADIVNKLLCNKIDTTILQQCLYKAAKGKSEATLLVLINFVFDEDMLINSFGQLNEILITIARNSYVNTYNCYNKDI